MTRKEKILKLIKDIDNYEEYQQAADHYERQVENQVKSLKLTKKELEDNDEELKNSLENMGIDY